MTMPVDELIRDLSTWDFSQGGPWSGHARAAACMKQAADEIKQLQSNLNFLEGEAELLRKATIDAERSRDGWIDINAVAGQALKDANDKIGQLRSTLEWLNAKGGLGLDVHDRIRHALSAAQRGGAE